MNIFEYVEKNNSTFAELPFNEVDAAVLCCLFYGRLENVINSENRNDSLIGVPIRHFYKQEYFSGMFSDGMTDKDNKKLLTIAAASPRFRNVKAYNIEVKSDISSDLQFAAVTFAIDRTTDFVCFRGTDGNISGWKEDFNMAFMKEVPAQREAVNYLNHYYSRSLLGSFKKIYVGGHSKGGNLAVYAGSMCNTSVRKNIKCIYNFDGPGFNDDVLASLKAVWSDSNLNIIKIVPRSSIIGTLLEDDLPLHVIESNSVMVLQHSAYTWEIDETSFTRASKRSGFGNMMDQTISDWLSKATDQQRKIFVDSLFKIFEDNDIQTVTDLRSVKPAYIADIHNSLAGLDEGDREVLNKMLQALFKSALRFKS